MNNNTSTRRQLSSAVLKVLAAALTINAVAWGILILQPDGEVKESSADIAMLSFLPNSSTQRFVTALDRLGHEPPRAYTYEGNDVFFSVNFSPKRPEELLRDYQDEFVRQGVNEKAYAPLKSEPYEITDFSTVTDEHSARIAAMLSGQLVPREVSPDKFVLHAAQLRSDVTNSPDEINKAEEFEKMIGNMSPAAKQNVRGFENLFKSFRHVTAEWSEEDRATTITAVWSGEDYDVRKILPKEAGGITTGRGADPDVPPCFGCERISSFESQQPDEPFKTYVFTSNQSPQHVIQTYARLLPSRGWIETEASRGSRDLIAKQPSTTPADGLLFNYVRGEGEQLTMTVHYNTALSQTHITFVRAAQ